MVWLVNNLTYRHVTYSHDQVDLQLIDHIKTDRGEVESDELGALQPGH
jgi:hypothetical protein